MIKKVILLFQWSDKEKRKAQLRREPGVSGLNGTRASSIVRNTELLGGMLGTWMFLF